jgi:hypothetical protein
MRIFVGGRRYSIAPLSVGVGLLIAIGLSAPLDASASNDLSTRAPMPIPLATSLQSDVGTWATLPMGHLNQPLNTFWQLFFRPSGSATWSDKVEATATATNGGLVMATAAGQPTIVGVRPANLLHFSPLISTTNGQSWSNGVLQAGLAASPSALSTTSEGTLALVKSGLDARVVTDDGSLSNWRTMTSARQLASSTVGRECGLLSLTSVVSLGGDAMVGGDCTRTGVVGIFAEHSGKWRIDSPTLSGSLRRGRVQVLSLGETPAGLTALLGIRGKSGMALAGAWTTGSGGWSVSLPLALGSSEHLISFGPASENGIFALTANASGARRLAVVNSSGLAWQQMPPPPSETATIAFAQAPGSTTNALAAHDTTMTVWTLDATASKWDKSQVLRVNIEFGSSS